MCVDTDYIFKYSHRNTIFMDKNIFVCKYLLIFMQVCIFVDDYKLKYLIMATLSRRKRFEKVASGRVQKVIDTLNLLQNCANTNNYEYDDNDVELMFGEINKALKEARNAYISAKNKECKKTFSFDKK